MTRSDYFRPVRGGISGLSVSESGEEFTILLRFSCRAPRGVVVLHCCSSSTRLSAILRKHACDVRFRSLPVYSKNN